jgi:hypothetical protein
MSRFARQASFRNNRRRKALAGQITVVDLEPGREHARPPVAEGGGLGPAGR